MSKRKNPARKLQRQSVEQYIKAVSTYTKKGNKKKLSRKTKHRINLLKKQKCKCFWCGKMFTTTTKEGRRDITLDHLLPRSMGGKLTSENLVATCLACNALRGNQMTNPITKEKIDLNRL